MQFSVSERIITTVSKEDIERGLEAQLKRVSQVVTVKGDFLVVRSIEASFGSINRSDTTIIDIREIDDGFLILANVHYRPSVAFWIFLLLLISTGILWFIPIIFYMSQKKTVRNGVKDVFERIKNEFTKSGVKTKQQELSYLDQLERLSDLKGNGAITENEFNDKKKELLGLH